MTYNYLHTQKIMALLLKSIARDIVKIELHDSRGNGPHVQ